MACDLSDLLESVWKTVLLAPDVHSPIAGSVHARPALLTPDAHVPLAKTHGKITTVTSYVAIE